MCQTAVSLISKALHEVDNAEGLLKIKNLIALFMQTMNASIAICQSYRVSLTLSILDLGLSSWSL